MLLLVYEYLTGGGLWSEPDAAEYRHPLLAEGQCMVEAVSEDLARVPDVQLVQLRDARCNGPTAAGQVVAIRSAREERAQLAHWSARADGTLLIAPEHGDRLFERCQIVQNSGGRLISPDAAFVKLTGDKDATATQLATANIPTPHAIQLASPHHPQTPAPAHTPTYPAVIKPANGVGSLDTFRLDGPDQWPDLAKQLNKRPWTRWRLEPFQTGTPVSVAALCGPRGLVLLPPCLQRISREGRLRYLGGQYPLDANLVARACSLARETLAALPRACGYVGIDMILSDDLAAQQDVVLDVNPRLTTSYVGLRRASASNLAAAMLAIGHGRSHPLFFRPDQVKFNCQGRVEEF